MGAPTAIRVLASPSVVFLNETDMLAAAAAIPHRQLRSGRVRAQLIPPSPPSVLSSPTSPEVVEATSSEVVEIPLSEEVQDGHAVDQGLIDSMFVFDDDDSDEEAAAFGFEPVFPLHADQTTPAVAHPPPVSPLPPAPLPLIITDQVVFDRAQVADQPRRPWTWTTSGRKTDTPYVMHEIDKWWYAWARECPEKPLVSSNIGRIMETELGTQLFGEEGCARCRDEGLECWVYTEKGRSQIKNPGSACARCRADPRNCGCSLAKRKPNRRKTPPPSPPTRPRYILPKGPGGPGPGSGSTGIMV